MADQWYYMKVEPRLGPFSAEQLKELAAAGKIRPQDTIWKDGTGTGVQAGKVKHLFASLQEPAAVNGHAVEEASPLPAPASVKSTPPATGYSDPDDMELAPGEPAAWSPAVEPIPESKPPPPKPPEPKKKRVIGVKGGVIISQDGLVVKYRKKCLKCSYADTNVATMPIRSGVTRVNFFCPKCKKNEQIEVQAVG